jgi:hypothetical protein
MIPCAGHAREKMGAGPRIRGVTEATVARIISEPDGVLHDIWANRDIAVDQRKATQRVWRTGVPDGDRDARHPVAAGVSAPRPAGDELRGLHYI